MADAPLIVMAGTEERDLTKLAEYEAVGGQLSDLFLPTRRPQTPLLIREPGPELATTACDSLPPTQRTTSPASAAAITCVIAYAAHSAGSIRPRTSTAVLTAGL